MEKPLLLLLNLGASVVVGLGVGQYSTNWLDQSHNNLTAKAEVKRESEKKNPETLALTAQLGAKTKNDDASLSPSPSPSVSPTAVATQAPAQAAVGAQVTIAPRPEEKETPSVTPSPTQQVTPSPTTPPVESVEPRTPQRSENGELHAAASVILPDVVKGKAKIGVHLSL